MIEPELASRFVGIALANIAQEFPNKLDHVLNSAIDVRGPHDLHPIFFGSYDWHSSVHMHWLLVRSLRLAPYSEQAQHIAARFDHSLAPAHVAVEIAYLHQPSRATFERTYGWAWLLKLQTELILLARTMPHAVRWRDAMQPLADVIVDRYLQFLPLAGYPIRAGTHANSAFGLLFALEYAHVHQHPALRKLITERAHLWFGNDPRYPAHYEPGGDDFLSGGLVEAALMLQLLDGCDFADWWEVFCPPEQELHHWLTPVVVTDRADAKLSHLDGLNLSRAWCWKMLLRELPASLHGPVTTSIDAHLVASLPHASGGDYVGTHWLATFAMLVLTEEDRALNETAG
ncbi:hypothetical protein RCH09_003252 [Actimicrobium sp. GrIS 1.19]|uniref:DUF2891 domain-containing protein n=1 Tax=Actimicrobium sp. GrIS 1.19 TaxID=3071708 RepID=UPI002DF92362|nr:hypothetical protein [Actimicrobium sp. GrIS 1.19]